MVLPRQSRQKHGRVACRKVQICPLDPDQLQTAGECVGRIERELLFELFIVQFNQRFLRFVAICRLKSGPSQRQPMKAKHRSTKYYTRCWVRGCSNTNRTLGDLSFHALPADEPIREYWIEQTKVAEPVSKSLRICSAHFGPSDFKMSKSLAGTWFILLVIMFVCVFVPSFGFRKTVAVALCVSEPSSSERRAIKLLSRWTVRGRTAGR